MNITSYEERFSIFVVKGGQYPDATSSGFVPAKYHNHRYKYRPFEFPQGRSLPCHGCIRQSSGYYPYGEIDNQHFFVPGRFDWLFRFFNRRCCRFFRLRFTRGTARNG